MSFRSRIRIIGIGDDGTASLTPHARQQIERADVLIGSRDLLDKVGFGNAQRRAIGNDLDEIRSVVRSLGDVDAVVLVSGDPLFYGIVRFLADAVGKENLEVVPHVSSMQLAFARIKEPWDDAYLTNLATTPLDRVIETIRISERVGLFTTETITPAVVASTLLDRRIGYFTAYVCENLGSPDERVTKGDLKTIVRSTFSSLNVMVLIRHEGTADSRRESQKRRLFGNPDELFLQSRPKRGLLTPQEIRCVAIAELDLHPECVVWDVGAGSGSLAIEVACLVPRGQVYAIEMDAEDYGLMIENARLFHCPSLIPIHGKAPEAWQSLPAPHAIFVGGTGRMVEELSVEASKRLSPGGRIVVNVASLDSAVDVRRALEQAGFQLDVKMLQVSRGLDWLGVVRLESGNPSFLLTGTR